MWPSADALPLTAPQRNALRRGRNTRQKMALRRTLFCAVRRGWRTTPLPADSASTARPSSCGRFAQSGLDGLRDQTRPGRKPALSAEFEGILNTTLHEKPRAATHWSARTLAKHLGVSKMAIQRVWKAHGLQPHRLETFKLSRDKQFVEKLRDVVGLYLNPPEHALVLSVDEKSQIQALDRSQPGLPLKKGRAGTMTHDFKRHGTTTLFAAFNVRDDRGVSAATSAPGIPFLRQIDRQTPPALELHLIVDNYSTHKHEQVKKWLAKHPRFHFHFIPTSSSWLNLVERWFRELTQKCIRRGVFRSFPNSRPPSTSTWKRATKRPSPLSGQLRHKISSPKSSAPPKPTPLSRTVSGTSYLHTLGK